MDRTLNGGNEIGDACNNTSDYVNSSSAFISRVLVQAYWSQSLRACVIPLGTMQRVSAVSSIPSGVTIFTLDTTRIVHSTFFDPQAVKWAPWFPLPGPSFAIGTTLAAVSTVPNGVIIFGVDSTGMVQSTFFDPKAGKWSQWFPLPGPSFAIGTTLAAVSTIPNGVIIFGVDSTGMVQSTFFDPQAVKWVPWFPLAE